MPTDIVMPQMGESIFEGTITKWLKKPGDKVQRDEPLFEISTDKVDAEIPAPASRSSAGHQGRRRRHRPGEHRGRHDCRRWRGCRCQARARCPVRSREKGSRSAQTPAAARLSPSAAAPVCTKPQHDEDDHARSSPLVRKIAREHNINLSQVPGTGLGGRITKQDITAFLEKAQPRSGAPAAPAPSAQAAMPALRLRPPFPATWCP